MLDITIQQNGISYSSRIISEGTLRILALCSIAGEEGKSILLQVRSARGGHGRAISEYKNYQMFIEKEALKRLDIIVVTIDASCAKDATKRKEILDETVEPYRAIVVVGCPDPHVERWYLVDIPSFQRVVGISPNVQKRKRQRGYYKRVLATAIRDADHPLTLGGIEFAEELLERARDMVPDTSIARDFIVGFPGETEQDFEDTVDLVQKARYKNAFIFKYSPRPGTTADKRLQDTIPTDVKQRRNVELLAVQEKISDELSRDFLGKEVKILVEGLSKKSYVNTDRDNNPQLIGRTSGDWIVVFSGPASLTGQFVQVKITAVRPLTLFRKLDYAV